MYVNVNEELIPVSENVQVYIQSTEKWTTLANARARSDNLSVYYDADKGGKVRVIVVD